MTDCKNCKYTDEYCASGDCTLGDNNLTEQWKKGELPEGWYYVKNEFNNIFPSDYSESYDSINDAVIKDFFTEVSEIKEVLEPVPSYEEWKASEKYNKHLEKVIKIYERKDKQATETSIAYNELLEENSRLKKQINHVLRTQARQFVDNQKLQVGAEIAKDVVNIDTARQIKQLKELLIQSRIYVKIETEDYDDRTVSKADKEKAKELLTKIDEILK